MEPFTEKPRQLQVYSAPESQGGPRTAKRRKPSNATIRAAEITGRALGQVAGSFDSLKARHPHPITEAREALAVRFEKFTALASEGGARSAAVVNKTKAVAKKTRKMAATVARSASRFKR